MKKLTFIYMLLALAGLMLFGYLWFYLTTYNYISDSFKISEKKYDFLESSKSLIDNLKDLESSQRGYLITGDSQYLEPFEKANYRLDLERRRFAQMINSYDLEKINSEELKELDVLIDEKIAEMQHTVALQKTGDISGAINVIKSDVGMRLMTKIIDIFQKLNMEQKYSETQAKQAIYASRIKLRYFNLLMSSFCLMVFIICGLYIHSSVSGKSGALKNPKGIQPLASSDRESNEYVSTV